MKKRNKLQSKKSIVFSTLIVASTGISAQAYVPYPDMQKNPVYNHTQFKQAVGDIYLRDVPRTYGKPLTVWVDGMSTYGHVGPKAYSYSEERKQSIQQILQNIRTIRKEIRTKADNWAQQVSDRGQKYVVDVDSYNTYKEKKAMYAASCLINSIIEKA